MAEDKNPKDQPPKCKRTNRLQVPTEHLTKPTRTSLA